MPFETLPKLLPFSVRYPPRKTWVLRGGLGLSIFVNFVSITLKKKSQLFDNHLTAKKIFDIVEYSTGPEYSIKKKVTRFWAENTKKSQF